MLGITGLGRRATSEARPEQVGGIGQTRRSGSLLVEAKGRGQITERLPAPVRDVRLFDAGESLQELDDRRVIEGLATNPTADRPRRNDDTRDAEARPDWPAIHEFVGRAGGRSGGRHVIEQAVVLVVVQNEGRLGPDLGVGGDGVDRAGHKRRAGRRQGVGMLGLRPSGHEPGHGRQPVVQRILFELPLFAHDVALSYKKVPGVACW